jgi:transcription termination/antitermination protein NusG
MEHGASRGLLGLDWFAVHVCAGREHRCAQHLSVRGYEIFLPSYREHRRWSDRVKVVERALFAGYVFCRASGDVVAKILTAPGVIRIVGDSYGPLPVATAEIETLRRAVAARLSAEPWEFLRAGQRVRVVDGPLRDAEGIVLRTKNRHRLIVSITLLQRAVAVEIDPAWIDVSPSEWGDDAGCAVNDVSEAT